MTEDGRGKTEDGRGKTEEGRGKTEEGREMPREHRLFKRAVDKWGRQAQVDMMIEECAELTLALCKLKRNHDPSDTAALLNDVCEEIADVQIVSGQMRYIFGAEAVDGWRSVKLERLRELLNR